MVVSLRRWVWYSPGPLNPHPQTSPSSERLGERSALLPTAKSRLCTVDFAVRMEDYAALECGAPGWRMRENPPSFGFFGAETFLWVWFLRMWMSPGADRREVGGGGGDS